MESVFQQSPDIIVTENEDNFEGEGEMWKEIQIHGDTEGVKSFARPRGKLADIDQS